MKRFLSILSVLFCLVFTNLFAQESLSVPTQNPAVRYRLFPTQNMWTFLKLDTMTGQIWQVQYSVKGDDYRFETSLSSLDITNALSQEKKI